MVFGRPASKDFEQYIPNLGRKYQDEVILRFNISTAEEEAALAEATERLFLDIWSWDGTVDLRVQKNYVKSLLGLLPPSLGSSYWVMVDDLPSAVYASYPSPPTPKEQSQSERRFSVDLMNPPPPNNGDEGLYFFRNYQPHKVVIRWMRLIEAMFPSFVRYTTIGQTYEGRDIPALVVGPGFNDQGQPRRTLVIMGGSHAREWISTTTVNYLAWALITSYGKDPLITKFLNKFDVVFIPELNPDGIEYTWSADRLWRKSRQHTSLQFCRGLDLDHAFGYQWDGSGMHQTDPCSESVRPTRCSPELFFFLLDSLSGAEGTFRDAPTTANARLADNLFDSMAVMSPGNQSKSQLFATGRRSKSKPTMSTLLAWWIYTLIPSRSYFLTLTPAVSSRRI